MKKIALVPALLFLLAACANETKTAPAAKPDTAAVMQNNLPADIRISDQAPKNEASVQNGEYIERYDNGVIKFRGMMKDGQRDGLWKSWYEDGGKWSETTFSAGKKSGSTTTWYESGQMRYTGFYTGDEESGKWTFWDEKGKQVAEKDYGTK